MRKPTPKKIKRRVAHYGWRETGRVQENRFWRALQRNRVRIARFWRANARDEF